MDADAQHRNEQRWHAKDVFEARLDASPDAVRIIGDRTMLEPQWGFGDSRVGLESVRPGRYIEFSFREDRFRLSLVRERGLFKGTREVNERRAARELGLDAESFEKVSMGLRQALAESAAVGTPREIRFDWENLRPVGLAVAESLNREEPEPDSNGLREASFPSAPQPAADDAKRASDDGKPATRRDLGRDGIER